MRPADQPATDPLPREAVAVEWHRDTASGPSRIAGTGRYASAPLGHGALVVRFATAPTTADTVRGVNHCCDPNLRWADDRTLVTSREVAVGEELTTDYATCVADPDFVLFCHCETYRCRQVIEGDDWRIPQLQARYAGSFTPRLQRRIDAGGR